METDACLFCRTYKKPLAIPGGILYGDALVYAYHYSQDGESSYLGHVLLCTRRHVPDLAELTEAEARSVGLAISRLSKAIKVCTGAQKVYMVAYYEVNPHVHLILTARYPDTPPEFWRWNVGSWPEAPHGRPEQVTALCDQMRNHLSSIAAAGGG